MRSVQDYDIGSLPMRQRDLTARFARDALKGSAGLPVGVQVGSMPYRSMIRPETKGLVYVHVVTPIAIIILLRIVLCNAAENADKYTVVSV